MKKILVIFDCFGVLGERVGSVFMARHLDSEVKKKIEETLVIDGDVGKITREEFFGGLADAAGMTVDEVIAEYDSLYKLHPELIPVIEKSRSFADTALLSNAFFGHAEGIIDRFNIRRLFDKVFLSCDMKLAKPDPEIYEVARDAFGKDYDEVYMVDDTDENLTPLSDIGIIPIKYVSPDSVTEALAKYF